MPPTQQAPVSASSILVLGDSLTEGFGVAKEKAFPAVLERLLKSSEKIESQVGASKGNAKEWRVINAGVSGATSASGLSRLRWHLRGEKPRILVLALGANDGLRGFSVAETEKNLDATIELARKNQLRVLLVGMQMPPNYGKSYRKEYQAVFERVAKRHKVNFLPFLLEGVAGDPKLNLKDGIHPNEVGHEKMADTVFKSLQRMLK